MEQAAQGGGKARKEILALGELLVDFVCKETDEIGYPTWTWCPEGTTCALRKRAP